MKIIHAWPPNIEEIAAALPQAKTTRGVYFAYAPNIYIPHGGDLAPSLRAHEAEHIKRQGGDPAGWWKRYLTDTTFRFDEELAAHQAEYRHFDGRPRNERRFYLRQISQRLAGRLYGGLCTVHRAKQLITGRINPEP